MARPEILEIERHKDVRVTTRRGAEFGEDVHLVPVIADELRSLVLDYPVVFIKDDETGRFGLHILLGFEPGENLYLDGSAWRVSYVPLHVRRQPFMVSLPPDSTDEESTGALITIDMDSDRVQDAEGEALFTDDGEWTPYLRNVSDILSGLIAGTKSTEAFIGALLERDLIEAAQINITFAGGEQRNFAGMYTVHADRLAELAGQDLQFLHERGYLQACYLMLASMGHVRKLIDLKNSQSPQQ